MQYFNGLTFSTRLFTVLAYCLLVIGLQFHCTITVIDSPIRLSLSDIASIPVFLLCLHCYWRKEPSFQKPFGDYRTLVWFIVFSLWLSFSLWWGYYNSGVLQPWAIINKFLGWFILVSYFCMGTFFSKKLSEFFSTLLKTFFLTSWLISTYFLVGAVIVNNFNYLLPKIEFDRFSGFLENPSAYGLFSSVVLLLQLPYMQKNKLFNNFLHHIGVALSLTSIVHSGSRTAIIAFIGGFIFLHTKMRFKKRDYIQCACYTLTIVFLMHVNVGNVYNRMSGLISKPQLQVVSSEAHNKIESEKNLAPTKQKPVVDGKYNYIFQSSMWSGQDYGGKKRLELIVDALKLWFKHPILGCGLGSFLQSQDVSYDQISKYEIFYTSISPAMMNVMPTKNNAIVLHDILTNCHVYMIKHEDWIRYENGAIRHIATYTQNFPKFPMGLNGIVKENNPSQELRKFVLETLSNSRMAPVSIHNTSIWLLTETGVIGLLLFSLFIVYVFRRIYTASNKNNELIMGGTAVLILFILASLTTEVMYQRHLWFILGLILASLKNENTLYPIKSCELRIVFS